MKPLENPNNLYEKAIQLEHKALQKVDVEIHLKNGSRKKLWAISGVAAGLAAIFLVGWIVIYPEMEQKELSITQSEISKTPSSKQVKIKPEELNPLQRFNSSAKQVSISNNAIRRFNSKLKKFNKSNT